MPTTISTTYCTQADIEALLSVTGVESRVDDDAGGSLSATETGYITSAIQWATAKVNDFCLALYTAADLATSWVINEVAIVLAAKWLSIRRGNPSPGSIADACKEAMERLEKIRNGGHPLADIGQRNAAWPAWSNVRVDPLNIVKKVRVERPISEPSATPYPQHRDYPSEIFVEP